MNKCCGNCKHSGSSAGFDDEVTCNAKAPKCFEYTKRPLMCFASEADDCEMYEEKNRP